MNHFSRKAIPGILAVLVTMALSACSVVSPSAISSALTGLLTATPQPISTPMVTPSPTALPTVEPSATLAAVPTVDPTALPTLTLTAAPKPTLSPTQKPTANPVVGVPYSFAFPALGINGPIRDERCSVTELADGHIWYWGCAGENNLLLLSHVWGDFKPLHDAYHSGALKVGLPATYEDKAGVVHQYVVAKIYNVTKADSNSGWAWASSSGAVITLVTCDGANNELRIIVRLIPVGATFVDPRSPPTVATTTTTAPTAPAPTTAPTAPAPTTAPTAPAPTLTLPANITVEAAGPSGAIVSYAPVTIIDAAPGSRAPVCSPASGSLFAPGTTTVICFVIDATDTALVGSFTVTVHAAAPAEGV